MRKYRFRADYKKFGRRNKWGKIDTLLALSNDEVEMALKAGSEFLKVMMEKGNLPDGEYYMGCLDIPIASEIKKKKEADEMGILKNRTCPKCGCPDGLFICSTVGGVNCSDCMQFIRLLSKKEVKEWKKKKEN